MLFSEKIRDYLRNNPDITIVFDDKIMLFVYDGFMRTNDYDALFDKLANLRAKKAEYRTIETDEYVGDFKLPTNQFLIIENQIIESAG